MSVVRVSERFQEREARDTEDGVSEYVRSFQVETDNPSDGPETVKNAPGIPRRLQVYMSGNDSNPYARCNNVEAVAVDGSRLLWLVTASYTTKFVLTGVDAPGYENPLNRPPIISWTSAVFSKLCIEGYKVDPTDGGIGKKKTAIRNSAGKQFDPAADMDDFRPILQVEKNFASYDPLRAYDYVNAVNSDPWLGAEPRQWKCARIDGRNEVETINGVPFLYWRHVYEFHFRKEKWDKSILDCGFEYYDGLVLVCAKDSHDQPSSEPANLDGHGALLPEGDEPVFLKWRVYDEKPFLALGLT